MDLRMMRQRAGAWVIAFGLVAFGEASVRGEDLSALAGVWIRAPEGVPGTGAAAALSSAAVDSFCGVRCHVLVDASTMTIMREEYTGNPRIVIRLDGSVSDNTMMTPTGPVVLRTTATASGGRLTMTTILTAGETRSRQALTIFREGETLIVERQIQRREVTIRRQVYVRGQ